MVVAMAKRKKGKGVRGLADDVVDHYSNLFAKRRQESIEKSKNEFKKRIKFEVIEEKKLAGRKVPKKIEEEVKDAGGPLSVVSVPEGVIVLNRKTVPSKVVYSNTIDEDEVPDVIGVRIREKAKRQIQKDPRNLQPWIDAEKFRKQVETEIDAEIEQEEQKDLHEKVIMRRRRVILRKGGK